MRESAAKLERADYAGDENLSYERNRFRTGRLTLDRSYRLMHLPLVNPGHAEVIRTSDDGEVEEGRFKVARKSLVAFIDWSVFQQVPAVNSMIKAVEEASFGSKVDFQSFERRKDRLHFTISPLQDSVEIDALAQAVAGFHPFCVRIASLWAGASVNTGRLYLPVYPERVAGETVINTLQTRAGMRRSDFFGLGLFNLMDHLSDTESADLRQFIAGKVAVPLFDSIVEELAVIETFDSLLFDYRVLRRVKLI